MTALIGGSSLPQVDVYSILAVFLAIGAVYIIGMLLVLPIKLIVKLVINGIIGAAVLFAINFIGQSFNFNIGINPITALVAGLLGVPGVILLIVVRLIM